MSQVTKYASLMPEELRRAVKGLGDEKRVAITMYLLENVEARFKDLGEALGLEKNDLTYHLRQLSDGLLIEKVATSVEGRLIAVYRISDFGTSLFESLRSTVLVGRKVSELKVDVSRDHGVSDNSAYTKISVSPKIQLALTEETLNSITGTA